jgi:ribosomal protein S18 acetylase RimI-like enzyme
MANDLPAISAIEVDSFTDPYPPALMERLQRDNPGNFFVAENNSSKIVGYCVASEKGEFAHLISIGVLREYRR